MEHIYLAFSVVFPLVFLMGTGYLLNKINVLPLNLANGLSSLCFKVLLPFLIFLNAYNSNFEDDFNARLIITGVLLVVALFLALMFFVPKFEKDNKNRGVIIQGVFRANFVLFGIPMCVSLFGETSLPLFSIAIAFIVPLFNLLSVVALETYAGKKQSALQIVLKIFKNPIIIGFLTGLTLSLTGINLPEIVLSGVESVANSATPIALIALGATFKFNNLLKYKSQLAASVLCKLVIVPLIFMVVSVAMGFRGVELGILLTAACSPTAVSSYPMAKSVNANDELAGQIVIISSIAAIITIFGFVSVLNYMGFL